MLKVQHRIRFTMQHVYNDAENLGNECADVAAALSVFGLESNHTSGASLLIPFHALLLVKTTPQMTRFRDAKVCNNLGTDEIKDHRTQFDYKCKSGLQYPKKKKTPHFVLRARGETEHDTNDNVTTKTQSTFYTTHMNIEP